MEKESFCNQNCELSKLIPQLLIDRIFGDSLIGEIENRYNDMRNNFNFNYQEWQDNFTTKGRQFRGDTKTTAICIPAEKTHFPEISNFNRIGMDLPTWSNINNGKPIVMFVAQDPLKSEWYMDCHDIAVSSPFAVHDFEHRNNRFGEVYFSIFSEIVKNGYGIYLTDIRKFFIKGNGSENFTNRNIKEYNEILKAEIDIIKPIKIVAFGKKAQHALKNIVDKNIIIEMIHPSGSSRGHIKKKYGLDDCSNKKIAEIYQNEILSKLK